MYLFAFIFNVFFYGFRDFFKRERWKLRKHHLGEYTYQPYTNALGFPRFNRIFVAYMLRWILQLPFGGIRLQKICSSDKERDLHDHPFDFITFRLWGGGYYEETPDYSNGVTPENWVERGMPTKTTYYKPFSIGFRRATQLHRLQLATVGVAVKYEKPQWTLFVHGPNLRDWGFKTKTGWMQWEQYEKAHKELSF